MSKGKFINKVRSVFKFKASAENKMGDICANASGGDEVEVVIVPRMVS